MCKHKHTTEVAAQLDDGTPLVIHQCDMCGMDVWQKEITANLDPLTLPSIDTIALDAAFAAAWRDVLRGG